ncbi:MAG: lytic transglycosylase domain-containing protein [Acidaminococcaceae bacterium]|nr:lytic transglycosylase domain-containing protein [Acidaminococcaceae bacterium]
MADARELIAQYAQQYGVDQDLMMRLAGQESGLNQGAISPVGATGVMQLMPETAAGLGVDPNSLEGNIEGGVKYFKQMLDQFGSPELALAAYNAGPGAVEEYGGIPPYAETQNYVSNIMNGYTGQAKTNTEDYKAKLQAILSGNKNYDMQGKLREILASRQPQQDSYANAQRTSGGRTMPTISSRGGADRGAIVNAISSGQDWEQPLLLAKQLIDNYRVPSVWDNVPRGMETVQSRQLTLGDALGRDELAETIRHNQAAESISRMYGGSSGGGGDGGVKEPATLAERKQLAESQALTFLNNTYYSDMQQDGLKDMPFVTAVENIRDFLTNPDTSGFMTQNDVDKYKVLDEFVRTNTEFPSLDYLTQYLGSTKTDKQGYAIDTSKEDSKDPLYRMLDLIVKNKTNTPVDLTVPEEEAPPDKPWYRDLL